MDIDFLVTTNGCLVICPNTDTPCSPMCPHYKDKSGDYAVCDIVEDSVLICKNKNFSFPHKRIKNAVYAGFKKKN